MFRKEEAECNAFHGKDTRLEGKIFTGNGKFRVEGYILGEVNGVAIEVGETALIEGKIHAGTLKIEGTVKGEVVATDLVEISSRGVLVPEECSEEFYILRKLK